MFALKFDLIVFLLQMLFYVHFLLIEYLFVFC